MLPAAEKGGWDFMDKEIHEDSAAVQRTCFWLLLTRMAISPLDEVRIDEHDFKAIDKIIVVACGTASYGRSQHYRTLRVSPWKSNSRTNSATVT